MIVLTALSMPFMMRTPIDLPPIISVELIQISEKTNLPFAPKAKEILEKIKKKRKKELFRNKHLQRKRKKKNPTEFLYRRS